jgi:hypothetical protein
MKPLSAALLSLLLLSSVPATLSAKGRTVKIVISGGDLKIPLELTDPQVGNFNVWAGPGVHVNGVEQTEGFIIDWPRGIVAQAPAGFRQYDVAFYDCCERNEYGCRTAEPFVIYVVSYAYNPSTKEAFVYLPGPGDEAFKFNAVMWHGHGLEGHWFHPTSAWQDFVNPSIAKAVNRPR